MKQILTILCSLFMAALIVVPTQATILSVAGPNSSAGTAPVIIATPSDILDDCVTNTGMQGFDEAQSVTTTVNHDIDSGQIPAGTTVSSHMIFLNSASGSLTHRNVIWTFDRPVIGVMSDQPGNLEAASTFELGAAGTNYTNVPIAPATTLCGTNDTTGERAAPYAARGLERQSECLTSGDGYSVSDNTITVCMGVGEPGDWIRVITRAAKEVVIDIKPGSDPNSVMPDSAGVIAVAILTTDDFDATTVDPLSVEFGPDGAMESHGKGHIQDADADGDLDLILHFRTEETGIACGDLEAGLTGETFDGQEIGGFDSINTVGCN